MTVGPVGQGLERLVYFSDAVMAIVLTLLALDLPVPEGTTNSAVWRSFVEHLSPDYFSFALSFVVIAAFWTGHHYLFAYVGRLGPGLIWRNFAFLFLIVVMPFATKLLNDTDDSVLGTVFYAATVCGIGLVRLEILRHARRTGLLRPQATGPDRPRAADGMSVVTVAFGLSIPIAFVSTAAAQYAWLVLTVLASAGLRWLDRRRAEPDASP